MRATPLLAISVLALASCSSAQDKQPVTMSVIGQTLQVADPNRSPLNAATALMLGTTAQGLVSFNAEGQIEPALAERWIMTDDGRSVIFRIRRTQWADGRPVSSTEVAARLRSVMAPASRNPMKPMLSGVDRIISMTGQVIEIRLKVPQPDFLQLMAQPEMAVFRTLPTNGTGPYTVHSTRDGVARLRLIMPEGVQPTAEEQQRTDMRVRAEGASRGIARFSAQNASLVTGGTFADLALVRAARPPSSQFQLDPAYGLFGLAVSTGSEVLSDVDLRRALAMAIDRDRIVRLFGVSNWRPTLSILPAQLDSAAAPAALEWVQLAQAERVTRARAYVSGHDAPVEVRIALPTGAGSRLLFAALAADWRKIGVTARMVGMKEEADLRLIDEVAPQSGALWYLDRLSCARGLPCSDTGEIALKAAGDATTLAERSSAIAEADAAFAATQPYIPIALPLRWSLVSPNLTGWRPSAFAFHPLRHLRAPKR